MTARYNCTRRFLSYFRTTPHDLVLLLMRSHHSFGLHFYSYPTNTLDNEMKCSKDLVLYCTFSLFTCGLYLLWYDVVAWMDEEERTSLQIFPYIRLLLDAYVFCHLEAKKVLLWKCIVMLHIDSNFLLWTKLESNVIYITIHCNTNVILGYENRAYYANLIKIVGGSWSISIDWIHELCEWDGFYWSNHVETKRKLLIYPITHYSHRVAKHKNIDARLSFKRKKEALFLGLWTSCMWVLFEKRRKGKRRTCLIIIPMALLLWGFGSTCRFGHDNL